MRGNRRGKTNFFCDLENWFARFFGDILRPSGQAQRRVLQPEGSIGSPNRSRSRNFSPRRRPILCKLELVSAMFVLLVIVNVLVFLHESNLGSAALRRFVWVRVYPFQAGSLRWSFGAMLSLNDRDTILAEKGVFEHCRCMSAADVADSVSHLTHVFCEPASIRLSPSRSPLD
jgi:hypothetical protein